MSIFAPIRGRSRPRLRVTFIDGGANIVDTNAALAAHFIATQQSMQTITDLRPFKEVRLIGVRRATAGVAAYSVELMATTAFEPTPGNFLTMGMSAISVNASAASSFINTGWVNILPAYRVESAVICPIASGGDGVADPNWGIVAAEFR